MWAAQYYRFKEPRTYISSLGLGTMGFGYPAAVGAKVARPDKEVIDIDGDGSFIMNVQELATAKIEKLMQSASFEQPAPWYGCTMGRPFL